ncbi:putative Ig domain-containing protein [bacterium]|nr:putative Ig domain-containing protein [bacterium]
MRFLKWVALASVCLSWFSQTAQAEPAFKRPLELRIPAGATTTVKMRDLLSNQGTGGATVWGSFSKPTWVSSPQPLTTDPNPTISITPPLNVAGMTISFSLSVQERQPDGQDRGDVVQGTVIAFTVPTWNVTEIDLGNIPEGSNLSTVISGAQFINPDPAGKPLAFTIEGTKPAWLSLSTDGKFTGSPTRADVGAFSGFSVVAATQSGGTAKIPVKGRVTRVCKPPLFTANSFNLPNATEDLDYPQQNIAAASFMTYTEAEPLVFTILSGTNKDWLALSADGKVTGKPTRPNGGAVSFVAQASSTCEGVTNTTKATFNLTVKLVNKPPAWSTTVITLPDGFTRTAYPAQNLATFASDPDPGTQLTFRLDPNKPAKWAVVSTTGSFSGTPQDSDLGANEFTVLAGDGEFERPVTVRLAVKNRPPKWNNDPTILKPDAIEDSKSEINLSDYAKDPEGDAMIFTMTSQSDWASIVDGKFVGTPRAQHVGLQKFRIAVSDALSGGSQEVEVQINVVHTNHAPEFTQDDIVLPDAFERSDYLQSLKAFVTDRDGDTEFTFEKVPSDHWAKVEADGDVTGKPVRADVGTKSFLVKVKDAGGLSDTAGVTITVKKVNQTPLCAPVTLKDAVIELPFTADVGNALSDPDGDPLTATPTALPAWMKATGTALAGTPAVGDVGPYTAEFDVTDPDGASCHLVAKGNVILGNKPPIWKSNPLVLPDALVSKNYSALLTDYVTDPEGDNPITFAHVTDSPWLFFTSKGRGIGTPQPEHLGLTKVTMRATDSRGASSEAEVWVNVVQKSNPPQWTKNPIDLGTATVGVKFNFDLRPFTQDSDTPILHFRKAQATAAQPDGAPWLNVPDSGLTQGTPLEAHVGPYTTAFEVSDNQQTWFPVAAFGKVAKPGAPPDIHQEALVFTVRAGEVMTVNLNQPLYVSDPDQPLTFKNLQTLSWVTLSTTGSLVMSPQKLHIGQYNYPFEVTDATGASAQGPIRIIVIDGGAAPAWKQDPIRFTAYVDQLFTASLVDKVDNPGNLPLTFTKQSGDVWLDIATNGGLSGTPRVANLGDRFFSVSVKNSAGQAVATLIVSVLQNGPSADDIRIDDPVPGARIDNTWIVNNESNPCSGETCFVSELRQAIRIYYDELNRAQVAHYGVFLAADACTYRSPIRDSQGRLLLKYTDTDWVQSFNNRISRAAGGWDYSSPITAFWNFLANSLSLAPAPYFEQVVPMDVLILSEGDDKYRNFSGWPVSGWTPANFTQYYKNVHAQSYKPLRISALAASSNAYNTAVTGTKGKYYQYGRVDFQASIRDYAQDVIFRAMVTAKRKIKLSAVPKDPSAIQVTLAGNPLANTYWRYLVATNEVEVFWYLIDLSTLKPGDHLTIQYSRGVARL